MKCTNVAVSIFLLFTMVSLQAVDFGLELSNSGGITKREEAEFFTDHKATAWGTIPFNNQNTSSLAIEGSFYASKPAGEDDFDYYLDVDLFRFSLLVQQNASGRILMDAGRFPVSDATGKILNQGIDGIEIQGMRSFGNFTILAGYTGFLNARQETNIMTADDAADTVSEDIYALGAKRIVAKFTVQFPELFADSDLIIEALGQYDLRDSIDSDAMETVHTGYGTVAVTGPLSQSVFYTVAATFQSGILESDDKYSVHSVMGLARLDVFPVPEANVYAEFLYTAGENDFFSYFLPITFKSAGVLYPGGYENMMKASAGVLYNPMDILNLDFGGAIFMNAKETDESDGLYNATEINAGATFKATSDLRLRFDGTLLFPKDEDMIYQAEIKVIFNL